MLGASRSPFPGLHHFLGDTTSREVIMKQHHFQRCDAQTHPDKAFPKQTRVLGQSLVRRTNPFPQIVLMPPPSRQTSWRPAYDHLPIEHRTLAASVTTYPCKLSQQYVTMPRLRCSRYQLSGVTNPSWEPHKMVSVQPLAFMNIPNHMPKSELRQNPCGVCLARWRLQTDHLQGWMGHGAMVPRPTLVGYNSE